jgi:hypothetical protein
MAALRWIFLLLNPNDVLRSPAMGELFWYCWWLLLLITAPAWLIVLAMMLLYDLLTLRIATSQWEVRPDEGKAILITGEFARPLALHSTTPRRRWPLQTHTLTRTHAPSPPNRPLTPGRFVGQTARGPTRRCWCTI